MSKTKDRILDVSLDLFNVESEIDHTAVDIANALDISPGNLYYHFKGKDAIIAALFDRFEDEMHIILSGSVGNVASINDVWVYTYIVLEEIYDFRFFYRNIDTMLQRYPALARRFRMILFLKRRSINDILDQLEKDDVIHLDPRLRAVIVQQILSTMTFWLNFGEIQSDDTQPPIGGELIHRTVFQVIALVIPFMGERGFDVLNQLVDYLERQGIDLTS